ncbi:hypothetical protein [Flavobacterium sp. '19STA2R22 D10 B1']|uniref:hypothetical protein n=1 Tax=Flavobacterium aerium TaxID=3037261 RepID=UPI00278C591C|nr:hypothetical protein [Flavobacterium sp. '19STA2R22 D10 B1']
MRKIIYLTFIIVFFSCNKNNNEKIILTSGLGMDPDALRFGIEVRKDSVFYCEEIPNQKGEYNYYKSHFNSNDFLNLKNELESSFKEEVILHDIVDAKPYQLNLNLNKNNKTILFHNSFLNNKQMKAIDAIIELKKLNFDCSEFHKFPMELLNEKLPEPPVLIQKDEKKFVFDKILTSKMAEKNYELPLQYNNIMLFGKCKDDKIGLVYMSELRGIHKFKYKNLEFSAFLEKALNQEIDISYEDKIDCFEIDKTVSLLYKENSFDKFLDIIGDKIDTTTYSLKIDPNKKEINSILYFCFLNNYLASFDDYIGFFYIRKSSLLYTETK